MGTLAVTHMSDIVKKAKTDPAFKQRLTAEPGAVLAEHGIEVPECCAVHVVEDSKGRVHVVLPWNTPVNHRLVVHRHFPDWVFLHDHGYHKEIVGQIIEKAWADDTFRARLFSQPKAALMDFGLDVGGREVTVYENTENLWYIVLPEA